VIGTVTKNPDATNHDNLVLILGTPEPQPVKIILLIPKNSLQTQTPEDIINYRFIFFQKLK
jgi:hypothetical protein